MQRTARAPAIIQLQPMALETSSLPVPALARPPHQRVGRFLLAVALLLILAELAAVAALIAFTLFRLTDGHASPSGMRRRPAFLMPLPGSNPDRVEINVWDHHGPLNVLLIGLDADDCAVQGSTTMARRADTIIVVRIDPQTKRAAMLSIPRDLYVAIPGHGARKINTAHVHGELDRSLPGGGPQLLAETIEANFDIPIHRYARVDFAGFERIIDAVGGIDIVVPPSPRDPRIGLLDSEYPDGHCGTITVWFPPGPQHLDGQRALQYARSRKSTSDFDRSRRQMQVLLALRQRALSLGAVRHLPELVPALMDAVDTDFTAAELISLARLLPAVGADAPTYSLDEQSLYAEMLVIDGVPQATLRPDPSALAVVLHSFMALQPPTPTPQPSGTLVPSVPGVPTP